MGLLTALHSTPISITSRCSMSKTAAVHWRPDQWLKSCRGKQCVWDQLFLWFPDLLSVALMQPNIWPIAFSVVLAGAVFAVWDSNRLFSQQSANSYLSKDEISPTPVCLGIKLLVPLFFNFQMHVKVEEKFGFSKRERRDHRCGTGKGKHDRETVLSHQAAQEAHLVCIWHWHS